MQAALRALPDGSRLNEPKMHATAGIPRIKTLTDEATNDGIHLSDTTPNGTYAGRPGNLGGARGRVGGARARPARPSRPPERLRRIHRPSWPNPLPRAVRFR